jgi:hypothetical protein
MKIRLRDSNKLGGLEMTPEKRLKAATRTIKIASDATGITPKTTRLFKLRSPDLANYE